MEKMLTFFGKYFCKTDGKFRVAVPASFRRVMEASGQEAFVLRKNIFENCMDLYPVVEWERKITLIQSRLDFFNPRHAKFFRHYNAEAQEVEMDASGRILLPKRLLEELEMGKELIFSGQGSKIEIWDQQAFGTDAELGKNDFIALIKEVFPDQML